MEITEHFFHKAKENLNASQLLFDSGLYNACANRAYYASLQAALASLEANGIKRDRIDHGIVQADFAQWLIKRKKVYPNKFKSYLSDMQAVRDQADYSVKNVSRKLASVQLFQASEFIGIIGKDLTK